VRHPKLIGFVMLALALTALPVLAGTMYARFSTPVRAERSLGAATLGTLKQGEAVEKLDRAGNYYKVSYKGRTGWVYYNKLTHDKPEDVASLLGGLGTGGGITLTELEAGGALRGLSPMAEDYAASRDVPKWAIQAVEDMQARTVSPEEMDRFEREGGLGEYGEEAAR